MAKTHTLIERQQKNGGVLRFSYAKWKGSSGLHIQSMYLDDGVLRHARRSIFIFNHEIEDLRKALKMLSKIRSAT
jgi:hypothetical protein